MSKILTGFHAVTSRLRQRPDSVSEIYIDAERSDARAVRKERDPAGAFDPTVRLVKVPTDDPPNLCHCGWRDPYHAS